MSDPDYQKIIVTLIAHFIHCEGTDYLSDIEDDFKRELTADERRRLLELRDQARKSVGWVVRPDTEAP